MNPILFFLMLNICSRWSDVHNIELTTWSTHPSFVNLIWLGLRIRFHPNRWSQWPHMHLIASDGLVAVCAWHHKTSPRLVSGCFKPVLHPNTKCQRGCTTTCINIFSPKHAGENPCMAQVWLRASHLKMYLDGNLGERGTPKLRLASGYGSF